jgi:hypothetical protein
VVYDGSSVKYLKNGVVFYTSAASTASTPNQTLFFDSSLFSVGATLKNIRFGPMSSNNWANIGGANKAADNATVGATIGTNLFGQMNASNISTYIAAAAIDLALINKASIANLQAMSALIGLLRTATSGARIEIADNLIVGYRANNTMSFKISA